MHPMRVSYPAGPATGVSGVQLVAVQRTSDFKSTTIAMRSVISFLTGFLSGATCVRSTHYSELSVPIEEEVRHPIQAFQHLALAVKHSVQHRAD